MTSASDLAQDQSPPQQWRFRFGLRSLFILMTILCVWLSHKTVRERRAEAINARYNALLDAILRNMANAPPNTYYRIHPGSQDEMQRKARWPGEGFYVNTILRTGSTARIASRTLILDVSSALATASAKSIKEQLLDHYTRGLAKLKMEERSSSGRYSSERILSRAVWASPANELSAVFDVDLHVDDATAEVRILLIDSQQLHLW